MKRIRILLITVLLILLTLPIAGAAFTDAGKIPEKNRAAVEYVSERGVVSGFPDGSFRPYETLTRAQAAKMLCVMLEGAEKPDAFTKSDTGFSDVPAHHWAAKYVARCAEKGIVSGVGNGRFDPEGRLTSLAFSKMLLVAYGKEKAEKLSGPGWAENTRKAMHDAYMDNDAKVENFPASRENACRLAYNFLYEDELTKSLPAAYREVELSFAENGKYRLLGRAKQVSDGVLCDWSADGVEFTADCGGRLFLTASVSRESWRNHLRFRVIVDGVLTDGVQFVQGDSDSATLATPVLLQPGRHTVRIVKDNIADAAEVKLVSLTFRANPDSIAPTQPRPKLLEVIGASTATGAGILPTPKDGESVGTNNTATIVRSFGYLTAEALNMDLRTVVKGSLGIVARAGTPKFNLPELYEYRNRYRDGMSLQEGTRTEEAERYDFSRKADIVILMINENDGKIPSEEWTPATKAFIKRIRELNGGNCKILFLYYKGSKHKDDIAQVLKDDPTLIGLGIRSNDGGSGGHAGAEAHRGWADQIIPLLQPFV